MSQGRHGGLIVSVATLLLVVTLMAILPRCLDELGHEERRSNRRAGLGPFELTADESHEARRHQPTAPPLGSIAVPAAPVAGPPPAPEAVPAEARLAFAGRLEAMQVLLTEQSELDRRPRGEDREARRSHREEALRLAEQRERLERELLLAMRSEPGLAFDLLALIDQESEAPRLDRLGRLLRRVDSPALGAELLTRLDRVDDPAGRRLALQALEASRQELPIGRVTAILGQPEDPPLRDLAAEVLGRALLDPARAGDRGPILVALEEQLGAEEASDRLRVLRPLRLLRQPPAELLGTLRALHADPDPRVREELDLLWRLWHLPTD